jgi:hypothetical protein
MLGEEFNNASDRFVAEEGKTGEHPSHEEYRA